MSQYDFDKSQFIASPETVLVKNTLDRVVTFMAELSEAPFAAITLANEDRNVVKASFGLETLDSSLIQSICDFSLDHESFKEADQIKPRGKGPHDPALDGIKFYAGAVMRRINGTPFGTLCIWSSEPMTLSDRNKDALKLCAQHAGQHIELTRLLGQSRNRNELLALEEPREAVGNYWKNFESLTPRQQQVLHAILDNTGDSSNKRIARILDISPRTVELHRSRVFTKMQVRSTAELVALAMKSENS